MTVVYHHPWEKVALINTGVGCLTSSLWFSQKGLGRPHCRQTLYHPELPRKTPQSLENALSATKATLPNKKAKTKTLYALTKMPGSTAPFSLPQNPPLSNIFPEFCRQTKIIVFRVFFAGCRQATETWAHLLSLAHLLSAPSLTFRFPGHHSRCSRGNSRAAYRLSPRAVVAGLAACGRNRRGQGFQRLAALVRRPGERQASVVKDASGVARDAPADQIASWAASLMTMVIWPLTRPASLFEIAACRKWWRLAEAFDSAWWMDISGGRRGLSRKSFSPRRAEKAVDASPEP